MWVKSIEQFSKDSTAPTKGKTTSYNQLTTVSAQDIIRVIMAYAFDRARLKYGYKLLRGADFDKKGAVDDNLRVQRFNTLKDKLRIEEIIDPELTIERALDTYAKKGYSPEWINQRMQTIRARKELTDAWDAHGVKKGTEYGILTDEVTKAWSGMTTRQYKNLKGLKKENLRDNMSTLELALNMLAEATTTELTNAQNPQGLEENRVVAKQGGKVAGNARKEIESQIGRPVITSGNAQTMLLGNAVVEMIETIAGEDEEK